MYDEMMQELNTQRELASLTMAAEIISRRTGGTCKVQEMPSPADVPGETWTTIVADTGFEDLDLLDSKSRAILVGDGPTNVGEAIDNISSKLTHILIHPKVVEMKITLAIPGWWASKLSSYEDIVPKMLEVKGFPSFYKLISASAKLLDESEGEDDV